MPKALAKSKNGQKTASAKQPYLVSIDTSPGPSQTCDQGDRTADSKASHDHHKPRSLSKASSRDERSRDHVLQKLCDKASKLAPLSVVVKGDIDPSSKELPLRWSSVTTPDQVSIRDCPLSISTAGLWGPTMVTAPPPTPPVGEVFSTSSRTPDHPSVHDLVVARTSQEHLHDFILPDNIQQIISRAIQQSLAVGYTADSYLSGSPLRKPRSRSQLPLLSQILPILYLCICLYLCIFPAKCRTLLFPSLNYIL